MASRSILGFRCVGQVDRHLVAVNSGTAADLNFLMSKSGHPCSLCRAAVMLCGEQVAPSKLRFDG